MESNEMKNLIIMIGNIGSGKSTAVKTFIPNYVVICRDSFRYAIGAGKYIFNYDYEYVIHHTAMYMLEEFLKKDVDIIIDETNVDRKLRKQYIELAKQYEYNVTAYEMPRLSMKISVDRRMQNPHGQFDRKLWESIWKRFDKKYKKPIFEEGFDRIITSKENKNA